LQSYLLKILNLQSSFRNSFWIY